MVNIYFGVNIDFERFPKIISSEEIINNFDKYKKTYISEAPWYGSWGRLTIKYYKYKFSIQDEPMFYQFHIHIDAIEAILEGKILKRSFQEYDNHYLTFDYEKYDNANVRIRLHGEKPYYNGDEYLGTSWDFLYQEIMLPKQEYMEGMLICIKEFFKYKRLVESKERWEFLYEKWEIKVLELEKRVLENKNK